MPARCQHKGCKLKGHFNFALVVGPDRGYCRTHMLSGMIYKTIRRPCQHEGCSTGPSFGFPGTGKSGSHCSRHKLEGMIRLRGSRKGNSKPTTQGERHRNFKKQNRRVGIWERYDPESEVRVKTEEEGERPSFGFPGTRQSGSHCSHHKLEGMIRSRGNDSRQRCQHEGCSTRPSFGFPGTGKSGSHCFQHKLEGMIRSRGNDIRQRCQHEGCSTRPSFGFPGTGKSGSHCFQHKLEGMIRSRNNSRKANSKPTTQGERHRNFKKQNRRVGTWERYDPESEVRVKTE